MVQFSVLSLIIMLYKIVFSPRKKIKNAMKVVLSRMSVYSKGGPPTAGSPLTM